MEAVHDLLGKQTEDKSISWKQVASAWARAGQSPMSLFLLENWRGQSAHQSRPARHHAGAAEMSSCPHPPLLSLKHSGPTKCDKTPCDIKDSAAVRLHPG